jgi:hypothetical protein
LVFLLELALPSTELHFEFDAAHFLFLLGHVLLGWVFDWSVDKDVEIWEKDVWSTFESRGQPEIGILKDH